MRWPEDLTVKFVNEYINHPCLWNVSLPTYKDRNLKLAGYKAIVQAIDLPDFGVDDARVKIKSLRSTYSQEIAKIKKAKECGKVYKAQLKWFPIMDKALRKVELANNSQDSTIESSPDELLDQYEAEYLENDDQECEETEERIPTPTPLKKKVKIEKKLRPKRLKVKKSENYDDFGDKEDIKDEDWIETSPNNPKVEIEAPKFDHSNNEDLEDEFELFGKYITAQLKNMPFRSALQAQQYIQAFLTQFRLDNGVCKNSFFDQNGTNVEYVED